MKKFMTIVAVVVLFLISGYVETHYTMSGEVVGFDTDEEGKEFTVVVDATGEEWGVYEDGFKLGDNVKIKFFTEGTDNTRLDDSIINIKKEV